MAAFLACIRACEGTAGPDGYRTLFGGGLFDDFSDHPRQRFVFRQTDGKENVTTAAGAYQFLVRTWDRLADKLGLPDFSPASQDAAAVELIAEARALEDVRAGRFEAAIGKVNRIWASLPGAPYPQPTKSMMFAAHAYAMAGGRVA